MLPDITFNLTDGALGRRSPSQDMVRGLIIHGVAVSGGIQLGDCHELKAPSDADDLGLDSQYDLANNVLVRYHIDEFFLLNPSGTLWIMLVDQSTAWDLMVDKTQANMAKKLLIEAKGQIRILGLGFNPPSGYTPSYTTGLDDQILAAITQAQLLCDEEFTLHRPLQVIIEGRDFNGTTTAAIDLRTLLSKNVSIFIGQDMDVAALNPLFTNHAAIGTILGLSSAARVNQNIGWLQRFNIQFAGRWTNPGLSSNLPVTSYSDVNITQLNTKGFILAQSYTGYDGVYLNDSHTATAITSDYAYIENVATIHKAVRLLRPGILPRLKGPIRVDKTTGRLPVSFCTYLEGECRRITAPMVEAEEVSDDIDFYVDPAQNILQTSELNIRCAITPTATARRITFTIGFNNPF
jgi:hypothetical protein